MTAPPDHPMSGRASYRILTAADLPAYLAARPDLAARLGGDPAVWRIRDVADGNLNSVHLVDGPDGALCVKQALPYVRAAGESWPLDINRAFFEYSYGARVAPHVGDLAPELHYYDPEMFVIVMEKLEPHVILRKALIAGRHHPKAAADVAAYVAATAFHTSDLGAPFESRCGDLEIFSRNRNLQRITVDVVFTDPYRESERNRVIPPLESWAAAFRGDGPLKAAVARARLTYLNKAQSLLHGDLHTGSVMVTETETRVIDGEFAWVGPTGFDIGNYLAHHAMAWFAKPFHPASTAESDAFRRLIETDMLAFWRGFETRFLALCSIASAGADAFPGSHFDGAEAAPLHAGYVADIFRDTLTFLGVEVIRRVLGFAQIADFLVIEDLDRRARAMAGGLAFARSLLLEPGSFPDIAAVLDALPRFGEHP